MPNEIKTFICEVMITQFSRFINVIQGFRNGSCRHPMLLKKIHPHEKSPKSRISGNGIETGFFVPSFNVQFPGNTGNAEIFDWTNVRFHPHIYVHQDISNVRGPPTQSALPSGSRLVRKAS